MEVESGSHRILLSARSASTKPPTITSQLSLSADRGRRDTRSSFLIIVGTVFL